MRAYHAVKFAALAMLLHLCGCSTTAFTLGSIHGHMLRNPNHTLSDFIEALSLYQPDVIFTEVRPESPGALNGSIDGGIEQSIIYAFGEVNRVEIVPVDWFDDAYVKALIEQAPNPKLETELKPYSESFENLFKNASLTALHQSQTQALARKIDEISASRGDRFAQTRNAEICANISKAAKKFQGRRILIIFGLSHKYALDDCVAGLAGLRLQNVNWLEKLPAHSRISPSLQSAAIQNMRAAKILLHQRLQTHFYAEPYQSRLQNKLPSFDLWIEKMQALR